MKRNFLKVSSILIAVSTLVCLFYTDTRAGSSQKPAVIRKKITAPPERTITQIKIDNTAFSQNTPAMKPKLEIPLIPKSTTDELRVPIKPLLAQNAPPVYNPKNKIDPFLPLFKERPQVKNNILVPADNGRPKATALETIELSQLKLTVIMLAESGNKGLVQEASGRGHVIKKGTYIGTRGGRVTSVQEGKVIVEEKMKDVYGKNLIAKTELKLNKQ